MKLKDVGRLVPMIPKLIEVGHSVLDLAHEVHAGTITVDKAKEEGDVIWADLWAFVLFLSATKRRSP